MPGDVTASSPDAKSWSGKMKFLDENRADCDNLVLLVRDEASSRLMDDRLREMAEERYEQKEFLSALFELALEEQWFDVQHLIQHDMAKAILADYSLEQGKGYLNQEIFYSHWEEVIAIGWNKFCMHTGLTMDKVNRHLQDLREAI